MPIEITIAKRRGTEKTPEQRVEEAFSAPMEFAQAYPGGGDEDENAEETRLRHGYKQGSTEAERGELQPDPSASFSNGFTWQLGGLLIDERGSFHGCCNVFHLPPPRKIGIYTHPGLLLWKTRLIGKPLESPARPERKVHTPCVYLPDGRCKYELAHGHATIDSVNDSGTGHVEGGISSLAEAKRARKLRMVEPRLRRKLRTLLFNWRRPRVVAAWKALRDDKDSPFCTKATAKREKRCLVFWTSRSIYSPWLVNERITLDLRALKSGEGLKRLFRDEDNGHEHVKAGSRAEKIKHECHRKCDCWMDWRRFVTWRPWVNPPAKALGELENQLALGRIRHGSALHRILEMFKSSEPDDLYRVPRLQWYEKRPDSEYVFTVRPRMRLSAWINGKPVEPQFVKLWECFWFGKIEIDWTLVRYDSEPVYIPAFVNRVSAKEIMEHFGVSRATAFRYIQQGARTLEDVEVIRKSYVQGEEHETEITVG